jgi:hypothetical protein
MKPVVARTGTYRAYFSSGVTLCLISRAGWHLSSAALRRQDSLAIRVHDRRWSDSSDISDEERL